MTTTEWGIIAGVAMSVCLALGPWMFMVHAKLAVVAAQLVALGEKVDKLTDANEERVPSCSRHQEKLEYLERRVERLEQG